MIGRFALALLVMLGLGMTTASRPSLAQGDDESWAPLTVIYTSDIKGKVDPCG